MANTYGNKVIVPLTNKSGGAVVAGDVVIIDTSNNEAFTTTTSGGFASGAIGVVQESIANNATGRVLLFGYAPLVNVNASVTRGNFGKTYTVAKQATDAGSSRTVGTFCRFLTGGTTPTAYVYPTDLQGSVLVDPTTTRGDLLYRDASALARLAIGATAGMFLRSDGTDPSWVLPSGHVYNRTTKTSDTNVTATSEATATTVITASGGVAFDGSTPAKIRCFSPEVDVPGTSSSNFIALVLYDDTGGGAASIGLLGIQLATNSDSQRMAMLCEYTFTPSNATHTFSLRAYIGATGTGIVHAGAGGLGNLVPAFLEVTKA